MFWIHRVRYRAMFYTLVTVALALLAITLWLMAMGHMLTGPANLAATRPLPDAEPVRRLFRGTLILALLLVCLLLVLGFAASWREWIRSGAAAKIRPTRYVDAWKVAGQRLKPPEDEEKM